MSTTTPTPVPPVTSDLRVLAAWHAEQSALLRDELAAEAREAGDEAEAAKCEAHAAGVRAESQRRAAGRVTGGRRRTLVAAELVDLPPLPVLPAARRRIIAARGW